MSDTPRVDAAEIRHGKEGYSYLTVSVEFARQLERELRLQHAEIERLKAENEALRRDAERYERVRKWICEILRVSDEVEFDAAMDASTAPAAAAVDALKEPATEPAIRARGEVPR